MVDADDAEVVGEVLQAVGNPHRLRLLYGLATGRSRQELAGELPISGSGVTNHLRVLADADLIYRGEDGWQVSPLGRVIADWVGGSAGDIVEAKHRLGDAQEQAAAELAEVPLSGQELERAVQRRKWELVREEVAGLLEDADTDA
ncbi:ArsR/SmtB family transcription factor [Halorarum salinum]|uniref:Helix-turn-helix transcriptional regulator n=1 Tax=Halorarum salinum TaxID=2743089 RepID=A0A7D5LB97_9EURY|nr:helix-turn-helix domain-containing protein [Halobaculum salinum]QLG61975.1 helix-turn-helix transcriptional regulator [Halobaculum salinum]